MEKASDFKALGLAYFPLLLMLKRNLSSSSANNGVDFCFCFDRSGKNVDTTLAERLSIYVLDVFI